MDAAAAPSVLTASCVASHTDGAATAAKIAGPPSEDDGRARLIGGRLIRGCSLVPLVQHVNLVIMDFP